MIDTIPIMIFEIGKTRRRKVVMKK